LANARHSVPLAPFLSMKISVHSNSFRAKFRRGFTLVEILVGLLVVAALAGGAIFVVAKVNQSATDTQKVENAKKMSEMLVAYWQAGGDMSVISGTATEVIAKMGGTTPLEIPSAILGSAPMTIVLPPPLPNGAAYTYTFDATTGPHFAAILSHAEVRP